jgi:hypothetical protein
MVNNTYMRKLTYIISFLFIFLNTPAQAANYQVELRAEQSMLRAATILSQGGKSSSGFVDGEVQAQIDISIVKPTFMDYSDEHDCDLKPVPEEGILFSATYWLMLSTDPNFDDAESNFGVYVDFNFDSESNLLEELISDYAGVTLFDNRNLKLEKYSLQEFFSISDTYLSSGLFEFDYPGGKKVYVKEWVSFSENAACTNKLTGGGFPLGEQIQNTYILSPAKLSQNIMTNFPQEDIKLSSKALRITFSASSKLPVDAVESTPNICIMNGTVLLLKKAGMCQVNFSQIGGKGYEPVTISKSFRIVAKEQTATVCVKGAIKRKVTGSNPKCPQGFRKQ